MISLLLIYFENSVHYIDLILDINPCILIIWRWDEDRPDLITTRTATKSPTHVTSTTALVDALPFPPALPILTHLAPFPTTTKTVLVVVVWVHATSTGENNSNLTLGGSPFPKFASAPALPLPPSVPPFPSLALKPSFLILKSQNLIG